MEGTQERTYKRNESRGGKETRMRGRRESGKKRKGEGERIRKQREHREEKRRVILFSQRQSRFDRCHTARVAKMHLRNVFAKNQKQPKK